MATLIIISHECDQFALVDRAGTVTSNYLLFDVLRHVESYGHRCRFAHGLKAESGDVAMLHVDCTIVPPEYLALGRNYARTLNFGTVDISKRTVSRLIVAPGDDWPGPVIVKNNLNCGGRMEYLHNVVAARRNLPPPHPGARHFEAYQLFDRIGDVPDALRADPALVVERFVPERDGDDYVMRTWVFMGPSERCTRFVTPNPVCKAADVLRYEPAKVPEQLRAERERLGFDYGKFDFLMHDGAPVLLDANRTPTTANAIRDHIERGAPKLAEGLHALLEGAP